jgi:hypothetical protein
MLHAQRLANRLGTAQRCSSAVPRAGAQWRPARGAVALRVVQQVEGGGGKVTVEDNVGATESLMEFDEVRAAAGGWWRCTISQGAVRRNARRQQTDPVLLLRPSSTDGAPTHPDLVPGSQALEQELVSPSGAWQLQAGNATAARMRTHRTIDRCHSHARAAAQPAWLVVTGVGGWWHASPHNAHRPPLAPPPQGTASAGRPNSSPPSAPPPALTTSCRAWQRAA